MTSSPPPARTGRVNALAARRIERLQTEYLGNTSAAVSALARLRRCDPGIPGADPTMWSLTLVPEELQGRGDAPSPSERAMHAALVLYAWHQQSREAPVHRSGVRLGAAVARLARARSREGDLDDATVKRFHQVALASDFSARVYFLRGLIQLMRAETPPIGFDYGIFADDLRRLATDDPTAHDAVLLRWGRDLHSPTKTTTEDTP